MRRFVLILCMLLNVSVMLVSFNSTHAHVGTGAHHHTDVHGGHSHDFGHTHDVDGGHPPAEVDKVVDLTPALTSQSSTPSVSWTHWLPLVCVVAILSVGVQVCLSLLRPPQSDPPPASQRGYWRPPLRGPPPISIQAF